jgi:hypothetical protein
MRVSLPRLSLVHLRSRGSVVALLVVVAVLLELAAGAGLAYVVGAGVLALLLPMPVSLAARPTLRDMGDRPGPHAPETPAGPAEPAL